MSADTAQTAMSMNTILTRGHSLLRSMFEYYDKGLIQPIRPIKMFAAEQVHEAFEYMQKGEHVGRIGITMAPFRQTLIRPRSNIPRFKSNASYLLVGGLGGIGRALSTYMVEHGARELIYLSRSAGTTASDQAFATELQSMGCTAIFVPGDVCNKDTVTATLKKATHPVKGIVQLSMVLRDQNFSFMTFAQWREACAPKIQGTWNLHDAMQAEGEGEGGDRALDFFVLCSSIAGQVGQPGQANYASANTFLDAFALWRNTLGLPASVVDIGAVEDVGALADNQGLLSKMKANGFHAVSEQELLDAFMVAMAQPIPLKDDLIRNATASDPYCYRNQFVIGLGPVLNLAIWKNDRRMAVYTGETAAGDNEQQRKELDTRGALATFLADAAADSSVLRSADAPQVLGAEIGRKLADMLLKSQDEPLATDVPLAALGMDSLVAAELRAWWRQVFRFDISVREMLGMGTLAALGSYAADGLLKQAKG